MPTSETRLETARQNLDKAFTPRSPISLPDLLKGRNSEIRRTLSALGSRGTHVVIYGDRGVGKTSIAQVVSVLVDTVDSEGESFARITSCHSLSSFDSIWRDVFSGMGTASEPVGFSAGSTPEDFKPIDIAEFEFSSPNAVLDFVSWIGTHVVVIIDEFDRVQDSEVRSQVAETIKLLADRNSNATVVVVGVANDVTKLIEAHASVSRNLEEIHVDRLRRSELIEIIEGGFQSVGMSWQDDVTGIAADLCHGYPYYAHLIGRSLGLVAVDTSRMKVVLSDVGKAIDAVLAGSAQTLASSYERAVRSPRKDSRFRQVLLACAVADKDSQGEFAAADVRRPIRKILDRSDFDISNYQPHLAKFITEDRGPILLRSGGARTYRYRFADPAMVPYVTLKGINDGWIGHEDVRATVWPRG